MTHTRNSLPDNKIDPQHHLRISGEWLAAAGRTGARYRVPPNVPAAVIKLSQVHGGSQLLTHKPTLAIRVHLPRAGPGTTRYAGAR